MLTCDVFPPLDTSEGDWEIGLVDLSTFNSIPNIENNVNNKFYYGDNQEIIIEQGAYEIQDIESYIINQLKGKGVVFSLKANNNTLKAEIFCSEKIDFTKKHSLRELLGFNEKILDKNVKYSSDNPVNIIKVNTIRVECNVAKRSFFNGKENHILHTFFPVVPPGFKIVEIPRTIIYLPINVQRVNNITVHLKDQNGDLINFGDETVSLRLHIRRNRNGFSI